MDAFHSIAMVNKHENILKRNVCGGHAGVPFKNTKMAAKTRKLFGSARFLPLL